MPRIVAMSEFVLPCVNQSNASVARGVKPRFSSGLAEEKSGLNSRFAKESSDIPPHLGFVLDDHDLFHRFVSKTGNLTVTVVP